MEAQPQRHFKCHERSWITEDTVEPSCQFKNLMSDHDTNKPDKYLPRLGVEPRPGWLSVWVACTMTLTITPLGQAELQLLK